MLLAALLLILLAAAADPATVGPRGHVDPLGPDLRRLYSSPVYTAERMKRPLRGLPFILGDLSHSGVRVTLLDGSQWLIQKGDGLGKVGGHTVVTDARQMSSAWKPDTLEGDHVRDFGGEKTVWDFVVAAGPDYSVLYDNCHDATRRMMSQ